MTRLFQINENGDINLDRENNNISNIVIGDDSLTYFNICRTIIITYFKYGCILKDNLKNKRNNFTDSEINSFLESHLDTAFLSYKELRDYVKFEFINHGKSLDIVFFYDDGETSKHIIFHTITI